jgi:DNA topoisomerase VI subunit B
MTTTFKREPFSIDRTAEFFTEKELSMQLGHDRDYWPAAILKELIDNALDAAENGGTVPKVKVIVEEDAVTVADNGPGLPVEVLDASLDYHVRVSDKAVYVSPTRGQLGYGLKGVWAAPYVANDRQGRVEITTGGLCHTIEITFGRIQGRPKITHTTEDANPFVKNGTVIKVHWPQIASYLGNGGEPGFYKSPDTAAGLLSRYAALNPHASFHLQLPDRCLDLPASDAGWKKWRPDQPTSPHWYTPVTLRALVAAHVASEQNQAATPKTVRAFVAEFAGLQGSRKVKAVLQAAGLAGNYLHALAPSDDVDMDKVKRLLEAMQEHSRRVQPKALGVLGEAHFKQCFSERFDVDPNTIRYKRALGTAGNMPFVVEVGFGIRTEQASAGGRIVLAGLNWSPLLRLTLPQVLDLLGENRVGKWDPVVVLIHLAFPRFGYTDHAKANLTLPAPILEQLHNRLRLATAAWKGAKRQADRQDRLSELEVERLRKAGRRKQLSIRQAAFQVMEEAYLKASASGTLPANARQVMYAARPRVLDLTDGRCWTKSSYFTQHLLPEFMDLHHRQTKEWDVVFDARGRLMEPHTRTQIDLGTLQVRNYITGWSNAFAEDVSNVWLDHTCPTAGPGNRYKFALFVEKEGFAPLLEHAAIADRFDLAIMSTKGMSVTAARQLVERLSEQGVTILVLRDFDKSGFSIVHTLHSDTPRYKFHTKPRVVDLGLRLEDVQAMSLPSEQVEYKGNTDPRINLRKSGATEEEEDFLVRRESSSGWLGQRVELNAMTSDQFIAFLERKLQEADVEKVVPDGAVLETAYRRAVRQARLQEAIDLLKAEVDRETIAVPIDLVDAVRGRIAGTDQAWDHAVWELATVRR